MNQKNSKLSQINKSSSNPNLKDKAKRDSSSDQGSSEESEDNSPVYKTLRSSVNSIPKAPAKENSSSEKASSKKREENSKLTQTKKNSSNSALKVRAKRDSSPDQASSEESEENCPVSKTTSSSGSSDSSTSKDLAKRNLSFSSEESQASKESGDERSEKDYQEESKGSGDKLNMFKKSPSVTDDTTVNDSSSSTNTIEDSDDGDWQDKVDEEFKEKMTEFTRECKNWEIPKKETYKVKVTFIYKNGKVAKVKTKRGAWKPDTLKKLLELNKSSYKYVEKKLKNKKKKKKQQNQRVIRIIDGNKYNTCHIVPYEMMAMLFEASIKGKTNKEIINVFKHSLIFLIHNETSLNNILSLLSSRKISDEKIQLMSEIFLTDQNNYPFNLYPGDANRNKSDGSKMKKIKRDYNERKIYKTSEDLKTWLRNNLIDFPEKYINEKQHKLAKQHVEEYLELFTKACESNQKREQFNLPLEHYKFRLRNEQ